MLVERSQVRFGTTRIEYNIKRSSRRSTVAISVSPPGEILITAPRHIPKSRLDRVVHTKARWIVSRLRLVRRVVSKPSPREFVSGETFLYLGRQYRLQVIVAAERGVKLIHGRLVVGVQGAARGREAEARQALVTWYRNHAETRLTHIARRLLDRIEVPMPQIVVRTQERRWGSCSRTGVLRFNWRIVQAPTRLMEYVVAHELVHLLHSDHSRYFWKKLGEVLPDYEARREDLRALGSTLEW